MTAITDEKAAVTICKGDWDYHAGFYGLADLTEGSALAVALDAAQYEMADVHCVWVEMPGETSPTFRFFRDDLEAE
jgi:hypothetical protein